MTMTVSNKPDFKKSNILANEILVASSTLVTFPIEIKKIVKEWSDIEFCSFNRAIEMGIDIEAFGSEAAVLQCKNGRYMIFYNKNDYIPRVKFSIAHEFGHYRHGHDLKRYSVEDEEYGRLEVEANCFAAQLLMPDQVLVELENRGALITEIFLRKHFGVSGEAAEKRIETREKYKYKWRSSEEKLFDETILYKYKDFIDFIMPRRNKYNWCEDEFEKQKERDTWLNESRLRY